MIYHSKVFDEHLLCAKCIVDIGLEYSNEQDKIFIFKEFMLSRKNVDLKFKPKTI